MSQDYSKNEKQCCKNCLYCVFQPYRCHLRPPVVQGWWTFEDDE